MKHWSNWLRLYWRMVVSALVLLGVGGWVGCAWVLAGLAPDDALGQAVAPALWTIVGWCRLVIMSYGVWCVGALIEYGVRRRR
jgi:hypothetical protein